jgi:SAM-dependent methyltransferase
MSLRSLRSHGQFFLPHLTPGLSVLDCGCGPGSISLDIADLVAPGKVVGVDFGTSQIAAALSGARNREIANANFLTADCYALPFSESSFDRVFSHALVEHLTNPLGAVKSLYRVLKPGGVIGMCSPDWGGFVLAPPSAKLNEAIDAYKNLQIGNGGDVEAGRKLGELLKAGGFKDIEMSARYECYSSLSLIGEYLALQLEKQNDSRSAATLRKWSQAEGGMFAQCWVSCIAHKHQ